MRGAILVIGFFASLVSFGTVTWLIPAADHAFRVTVAGSQAVTGLGETIPASIRERALVQARQGRQKPAGELFLSYHARWAVVGATLTFALFGLGVAALRVGGAATAGIATLACLIYITYGIELKVVSPSLISKEPVALVLAWLPNLWLIVTSLLFLSARRETHLDI
jgi:lipopolysaccharide export LptBFGC system permease protein LptF